MAILHALASCIIHNSYSPLALNEELIGQAKNLHKIHLSYPTRLAKMMKNTVITI